MKGKIVLLVVLTFVLLLGLVFVVMQQRATAPEEDLIPTSVQTEPADETPVADETAGQNPETESQVSVESEAPQLVFPEEETTAPAKQEENPKETQRPQTSATEVPGTVRPEPESTKAPVTEPTKAPVTEPTKAPVTEATKEPATEATEQTNSNINMDDLDENELPPMPF